MGLYRAALAVACGIFAAASPAFSADLGPGAAYVEPAPVDPWKFSFTPYGWFTGINGNVTARGHTVDVDESFIEIAEKSDMFAALMGYFEARKGRFGFFTDAVWADLGFPGHVNYDINRSVSGNPFARLPDFKGTIKGNLDINGTAQLDYQETIIQSGVAFEIAKWGNGSRPGYTALDILGSARYWNQDVDLSLRIDGKLTADIEADFKRLGLTVEAQGERSRSVVVARANDLEWVDPVVGARMRHRVRVGIGIQSLGRRRRVRRRQRVLLAGRCHLRLRRECLPHDDAERRRLSRAVGRLQRDRAAWQGRFRLGAARSRARRSVPLVAPKGGGRPWFDKRPSERRLEKTSSRCASRCAIRCSRR